MRQRTLPYDFERIQPIRDADPREIAERIRRGQPLEHAFNAACRSRYDDELDLYLDATEPQFTEPQGRFTL